jgi:hypothetical protein
MNYASEIALISISDVIAHVLSFVEALQSSAAIVELERA